MGFDPTVFGTSLAAIVGLLSLYKSEGKARVDETFDCFIEWLRRHDHKELVEQIRDNGSLSQALKDLVELKHNELQERLDSIDESITFISSQFEGFEAVAKAIDTNIQLSDQAVSILKQLNEADTARFMEIRSASEGQTFDFVDRNGELTVDEARFIADDLAKLCKFGCLLPSRGPQGIAVYTITRLGAQMGRLMK